MDGDGFPCGGSSQEMKTEEKARIKRCNIKSCKQSAVCSLLDEDSWRSMVPRKKRSLKMPVIDIEEEGKKEKAALSLMALSKDTRPWGTTADHCSNSQASDDDTDEYFNASVLLTEDEFKKPAWNIIVDDQFREKEWKKEVNIDHGNDGLESGLKSVMKKMMIKRFECMICGKAFGSGQGLGCHKRAHKVS